MVITNFEIFHGVDGSLSNFLDVILSLFDLVMDTRYDRNNYKFRLHAEIIISFKSYFLQEAKCFICSSLPHDQTILMTLNLFAPITAN